MGVRCLFFDEQAEAIELDGASGRVRKWEVGDGFAGLKPGQSGSQEWSRRRSTSHGLGRLVLFQATGEPGLLFRGVVADVLETGGGDDELGALSGREGGRSLRRLAVRPAAVVLDGRWRVVEGVWERVWVEGALVQWMAGREEEPRSGSGLGGDEPDELLLGGSSSVPLRRPCGSELRRPLLVLAGEPGWRGWSAVVLVEEVEALVEETRDLRPSQLPRV